MFLETAMNNEDIKILIVGVGGGGGNAVNRMIEEQIKGVDYIVANTDYQALQHSLSESRIQLGEKLTKGLGAGAKPEIGKKAAEESYEKIKEELVGAQMIFVAAGMGGGTGTGASPIIAKVAKEIGALTVGIVTMPFKFEGTKKKKMAEDGLEELKKNVDSIIVIPNDKILEISPKGITFEEALKKGNEILKNSVKGITDIIKLNGIINTDFADVKTVMENKSLCHMGFGRAKGDNKALEATKLATVSHLSETSIWHAKDLLVNVTSSESITMDDIYAIGDYVREAIGEDEDFASDNVIVGSVFSDEIGDEVSVVIIATGIDENGQQLNTNRSQGSVKEVHQKEVHQESKVEKSYLQSNTDDLDIDNDLDIEPDNIQSISEITTDRKPTELKIPPFLKSTGRK